MPSVTKEQCSRGPKCFFPQLQNDLDMYDIYVWQRLPDRTFPLLNLFDFSRWKLSAELLISYIGICDKLLFFIFCRLLSGVRDRFWQTERKKIMLRNFSQGWLWAFILTLTAPQHAAMALYYVGIKTAIIHTLWHRCHCAVAWNTLGKLTCSLTYFIKYFF